VEELERDSSVKAAARHEEKAALEKIVESLETELQASHMENAKAKALLESMEKKVQGSGRGKGISSSVLGEAATGDQPSRGKGPSTASGEFCAVGTDP